MRASAIERPKDAQTTRFGEGAVADTIRDCVHRSDVAFEWIELRKDQQAREYAGVAEYDVAARCASAVGEGRYLAPGKEFGRRDGHHPDPGRTSARVRASEQRQPLD